MLLRSITKHVKDQNWFAVLLDFFIVVVGILIAFQITNWNEARVTAERQKVVETRLISDFQILDQSIDAALFEHASLIRNIATLQDSIARGEVRPKDDASIKNALVQMRTYPDLIWKSVTYQELASSGTLGLIRSDKLRNALAQYDEQAKNRLFNFGQIRSSMQQVFINAAQYAEYAPLDLINIDLRPIASYDIKGMSNDDEFRKKLEYTLTMQTFIYSNLKTQREEVDAVFEAMEIQ